MNFEKKIRLKSFQNLTTVVIRFNLLQVFSSVPLFAFLVLVRPSFNVLNAYFYVLLSLAAAPLSGFTCQKIK